MWPKSINIWKCSTDIRQYEFPTCKIQNYIYNFFHQVFLSEYGEISQEDIVQTKDGGSVETGGSRDETNWLD